MKLNSAFLFTASAAIIWGATAPIMKLTLTQVPVFSLVFIRISIAALILLIFVHKKLEIKKKDIFMFIWAALTGVSFNLTFFFLGLKLTEAITASFLVASVPILTILAAHFYLREKLSFSLISSSIIALVGIIIIIGKPLGSFTLTQTIGNMLLLIATFSWVVHEIIAKKLLTSYSADVLTFYLMAIGSITLMPLFIWEYISNPNWTSQINLMGIAGIVYGIIFASLIAYWFWQKGLSLMPAGQAAFFFYLDPVSGTILSIILLGEKLTPQLLIGGLLIATAVLLVEQKRRAHPLHR
ncbi:hypothetical protein A3B52_02085 [Candidatus Curtissbacteria bacterium RIFCSPLOWO2_01_FULL_41_28]|uniref:EamA domain-containing protein n=1 Tax=Candidatus Curtissbacteria bacterium RIFOXYA1_FULL_41_14 TaxID=1797737 RepID=A0A1F5HCW5_9BACT|nr:MAG: hypothetical protein A3E14_00925 [Candidatus Curtissbacteria bacterium RIFCSPHIGHO2_12_FULL_41_13]OGD95845.1 MAG: hypothetical protein A3B52_02085 [Candidatus Curtissbacteria bacterium RIFCSPLOWO2_01_FULL_41_28]OGE01930.1 MAG: hypothetical protein A2196_04955 [Candidatus Curtissbacteria bacterium RIFOXYA1_FULL_41_14]OGE11577.1 MAG: hypothetical protein A2470_02445 [Candidatus Curtissbacteria bacterium RIFOXYC2_FULL_41_11]OGE12534.1 MAG: hypothetical protein A2305_02165 [Candidatus Curti